MRAAGWRTPLLLNGLADPMGELPPGAAPEGGGRTGRRTGLLVFLGVVCAATVAVLAGVRPVLVFGPLVAYVILRVGLATFNSLDAGADHIPDSDPVPVDLDTERTVYWCNGCGAEVLLLVRGTPLPPRHCGEKMSGHLEIAGDRSVN